MSVEKISEDDHEERKEEPRNNFTNALRVAFATLLLVPLTVFIRVELVTVAVSHLREHSLEVIQQRVAGSLLALVRPILSVPHHLKKIANATDQQEGAEKGRDEIEHVLVTVLRHVYDYLEHDEHAQKDEHAELQEGLVLHVVQHRLSADVPYPHYAHDHYQYNETRE